jgi:hypothetical protein
MNQARFAVYSFTYAATRPGQFLTIAYTLQTDIGGGNVTLYAATLAGASPKTTQKASITPLSYAQATNHTPVFVDVLRDNKQGHAWLERPNDISGGCFFKEEAYHVTANAFAYHSCGSARIPLLQNFAIQGEVMIVKGGGGFDFRFTSPNFGYLFYINQDQTYTVVKEVGEKNIILLHDSSLAIASQPGATNLLAVLAQGNKFNVYANNQFITSFIDDYYSNGSILGLAVSNSNSSADIVIRNLQIWTL